MKTLTISLFMALLLGAYLLPGPEVERAPGMLAPDEPRQNPATGSEGWRKDGYRVAPLATYSIRARVLLVERYWLWREADLSPLDLTLGWGPMSDTALLGQFRIYAGHRCFYWKPRTQEASLRTREVISHTANVHLIPANDALARQLKSLRRGSIVELGGFLVEATGPDGWRWRSSLSREDSGQGACEVMWVEWAREG